MTTDLSAYYRRMDGDMAPRVLPSGCLACGLSLVSCDSLGRCCGECRGHE